MKKSNYFYSITLCVLALSLLVFQSCRKPRCPEPKDPCSNPVNVTGAEESMYFWGHFIESTDNNYKYLFAENWNDYSSKVKPGGRYRISYKEVPCHNRDKDSFFHLKGIRAGGCVMYPSKCIKITCLQEIKGCFETNINPGDYDERFSIQSQNSIINGDRLNARVSYSGCSPDEKLNLALYLKELPDMDPQGKNIFSARTINNNDGITCQAIFSQDACFDLSEIRSYYIKNNRTIPEKVTIQIVEGNEIKNLEYRLK